MNSEDIDYKRRALHKLADYLARRDHSVKELKQRLSKSFEKSDIEWALGEAQNQNWLSPPEEIAERAALSLQRKKKGILYVNRYLIEKGLPSVDKDWKIELDNARELIENKYGPNFNFSYEERQKAYKYLSNRGYDEDTVRQAVKRCGP